MRSYPKISEVQAAPLPPFDSERPCRKCGHDVISTHHQEQGCDDPSCAVHPAECLVRTCQRCRFQWFEAVLV